MPQPNGDLLIYGLVPEDSKPYTCQDMESNESIHTVFLVVRTVPPAVPNLTVIPHSVFALLTWSPVADDGGHPVDGYVLAYRRDSNRLETDPFDPRIPPHSTAEIQGEATSNEWSYIRDIAQNATSKAVYGLVPNSTYYFRLCAVNRLGMGRNVSLTAKTLFDESEVEAAHDLVFEGRGHVVEENEESTFKMAMVGITVFVVTFAVIGFGISLLLIRNCDKGRRSGHSSSGCDATEEEAMELVPHITLNPSFNIDMLEFEQGEDRSDAIANQIEEAARERDRDDGSQEDTNLVRKSKPQGVGAAPNARVATQSEVSPSRPNG